MEDLVEDFVDGKIIAISGGSYDDYRIFGFFKTLKTFDANQMFAEWANETEQHTFINMDGSLRVNSLHDKDPDILYHEWLTKKGCIEKINYRELYTGDYDEFYLEERTKK